MGRRKWLLVADVQILEGCGTPCTLRMMGQTDPYGGEEERGWERKSLAVGMDEENGRGRSGVVT